MTMPRFAQASESRPTTLHKGQETLVYDALTHYPGTLTLLEIVQRCYDKSYEGTLKQQPPPQSEVWASVLYHLGRLKEREFVREISG